jgi:Family of unknown function (DUF6056)
MLQPVAPAVSSALTHREGPVRKWHIDIRSVPDAAMAVALLTALAAYSALGIFSRYVADDYAQVVGVRLRGFWSQQFVEYRSWTGRFASTAAVSAAGMLNEQVARVLPGLLLAVWVVLLYWLGGRFVPRVGRVGRLLLATGIVFATIQITPSPFLSIYWMTGSLTYVMPLLLATLLVTLVCGPDLHASRRMGLALAVAFVAFVAGGADETYLVAQTTALTMAVAVAASPWAAISRRKFFVLASGLLGSLIAAGVVLAAPGNAIRSAAIAHVVKDRPSVLELPGLTAGFADDFFRALFATHWMSLLSIAVLAGLIAARSDATERSLKPRWIVMGAVTIAAFLVVTFAIAPSAFEEARLTVDYAQIVLVYICVCVVAAFGWLCGQEIRILAHRTRRVRSMPLQLRRVISTSLIAIVGAGVIVGPAIATQSIVSSIPAIQGYAATKDAEAMAAREAHAAGRLSATVPPLSMVDDIGIFSHSAYEDLMHDPAFWINRDEAEFYGLASLDTSTPTR